MTDIQGLRLLLQQAEGETLDWHIAAKWASETKDLIGYPLAAAGAVLAYIRWSRDESLKRELLAFENVDAIFADPASSLALNMIDWYSNTVPVPASLGGMPGQTITWTPWMVSGALRTNAMQFDSDEVIIRGAFDALLNRLSRLGYHVRRRAIARREVPRTITYYFRRLDERDELPTNDRLGEALRGYIEFYEFPDVDVLMALERGPPRPYSGEEQLTATATAAPTP